MPDFGGGRDLNLEKTESERGDECRQNATITSSQGKAEKKKITNRKLKVWRPAPEEVKSGDNIIGGLKTKWRDRLSGRRGFLNGGPVQVGPALKKRGSTIP